MKIKFIILAAFMSLGIMTQTEVQAQERPGRPGFEQRRPESPEEMAKRRVEDLKEKLNLSEEQEKSILEIMLKSIPEKMNPGERPDMKKMEEERNRTNEEIRGLLTDEQKAEFDKILAQEKERMADRPGRRGRDRR